MEGGPPSFAAGLTCPALLGIRPSEPCGFAYGALTRFGRPSHAVPLPYGFVTAPRVSGPGTGPPTTPHAATPRRLTRAWVWACALPLAATRAISVDFSSSGYLDVSVPRVVPGTLFHSGAGRQAWPCLGCPIRESADRRVCAPPRGLSQLAAPFVDFLCQGIRRAPLTSSPRTSAGRLSCLNLAFKKVSWVSRIQLRSFTYSCVRIDANHHAPSRGSVVIEWDPRRGPPHSQ